MEFSGSPEPHAGSKIQFLPRASARSQIRRAAELAWPPSPFPLLDSLPGKDIGLGPRRNASRRFHQGNLARVAKRIHLKIDSLLTVLDAHARCTHFDGFSAKSRGQKLALEAHHPIASTVQDLIDQESMHPCGSPHSMDDHLVHFSQFCHQWTHMNRIPVESNLSKGNHSLRRACPLGFQGSHGRRLLLALVQSQRIQERLSRIGRPIPGPTSLDDPDGASVQPKRPGNGVVVTPPGSPLRTGQNIRLHLHGNADSRSVRREDGSSPALQRPRALHPSASSDSRFSIFALPRRGFRFRKLANEKCRRQGHTIPHPGNRCNGLGVLP